MADSKITALTALTAADPANDMLPVVDVSDTSMAASGTTKRISINNILACSPSATLASATISGDLTVDTNTLFVDSATDRVGIGTVTPVAKLILRDGANRNLLVASDASHLGSAGIAIGSFTDNAADWAPLSLVAKTSIAFGLNGTTAMTLNANGLGVGGSPNTGLLTVGATTNASATANALTILSQRATFVVTANGATDAAGTTINYAWASGGQGSLIFRNAAIANVMTLDSSGNVGIGVTPSAWNATYNVLDIGQNGSISGRTSTNNTVDIVSNGFRNSGGTWVYKLAASSAASRYQIDGGSGSHLWYNAVAGTAGNTIAGFSTPIMTLDANGNLILLSSNTPSTLTTNGQLTVNATSNTNLRFSYRGSDGTTRVANITLA